MNNSERNTPWWLMIFIGAAIIAVSIFLLADRTSGLVVLTWAVALGASVYGIYNLVLALRSKDDTKTSIPLLVHGLLDIVLVLLIIVIPDTQELLGIIIACWLIVFGVFEVITGRKNQTPKRSRAGAILVLTGLAVLIIPLMLSIDYVILIGIAGLVLGIIAVALGIVNKVRYNERTSGGRSNLI